MEESPVGVKHSANIADPAVWVNPLNGYSFDSMNHDALMAWNPSKPYKPYPGSLPQYSVLVVPQQVLLSPNTQKKIEKLKNQGVIVIDEPYDEPYLYDLAPDVQLPPDITFCHRNDGMKDIYFVSNQSNEKKEFQAIFRCSSERIMFYDPLENRHFIDVDDVISSDSLTVLRMRMEPYQSLFVLFGEESIEPDITARWHVPMIGPDMPQTVFEWKTNDWQLEFEENGFKVKSDTLFSWTDYEIPEVRYYSGHVRYTTTLHYHGENVRRYVKLDLGDVRDIAHVWLNGHDLGVLWFPPFTVDVNAWLQEGENTLEIEVVNTWHNALRGADLGTPPYDGIWTNAKYRTKGDELLPAGLLGPVKLEICN